MSDTLVNEVKVDMMSIRKDDQRNLGDLKIETITEGVKDAGVVIEGVTLKDGTITTTGPEIKSVDKDVVAHAGGTKAGAIADAAATITEQINIIKTCATALDSVVLPAAVVGMEVKIANLGATNAAVYAAGTDTIDDLVTANPIVIVPEVVVTFSCFDTGKWQSDAETEMSLLVSAGVSGAAGTVEIFPSTALRGKTRMTTTNQTGDTIVDIVVGAMAAARTITLRDPGAAASILTTTDATAAATTATAAEISQACDISARAPIVMVAGAYNILSTNSGILHVIPDTTAITATLPAAAAGLNYEFLYAGAAAEAHNHVIQGAAGTALFKGGLLHVDTDDTSAGVFANGSAHYILTLNVLEVGTYVKVWSDGTVWYITGTVYSATAPAFT